MSVALAALALVGCSSSESEALRDGALAEQQFQAGQITAARQSIARAVSQRDDIVPLLLLRGRIEQAAKSSGNAYVAYRQALALDADNVEALQNVAQLGLSIGQIDEAEDATNRLLLVNPRDPAGLITRGLIYLIRRRMDDALTVANRLVETSPEYEAGSILKARVLLIQGKTIEARDTIAKMVTQYGSTSSSQLLALEIARQDGDAATMLAQFAKLRRTIPAAPDLRLDEADIRYRTGDTAGARPLVALMLRDKATDAAWAGRIVALLAEYDSNPFDDAQLRDLGRSATAPGIEELGTLLLDRGHADRAAILLGGAPPRQFPGLRARIAAAQGRYDQALALSQVVLAADPTDCHALLARSVATLHRRQIDAAVLAAQTAQAQCARIAGGWLVLARAMDAKRDTFGARRAFEQGIAATPRQSFVPAAYADWLLARKEDSRAIAVVSKLTQTAPALISGWALYRRVAVAVGDKDGVESAETGLAEARKLLGIDMPPGEQPARGLLYARLKRA